MTDVLDGFDFLEDSLFKVVSKFLDFAETEKGWKSRISNIQFGIVDETDDEQRWNDKASPKLDDQN